MTVYLFPENQTKQSKREEEEKRKRVYEIPNREGGRMMRIQKLDRERDRERKGIRMEN